MKQPYPLLKGWFLEGCTNLVQKKAIAQALTKAGLSPLFAQCDDDFLEGNDIEKYMPTDEDEPAIMAKVNAWKEKNKHWVDFID